jgi:signal transduction histidine kinase/CheY-like chemotaxis protein
LLAKNRNISTLNVSRPIVRFAYASIITIGGLALLAWTTGLQPMLKLIPNSVPMNPLVAIMFILSGLALILLVRNPQRSLPVILLSAIIIAVATVKLSSYLFGVEIPIDQVVFHDKLHGDQMANTSALNFLLCGFALLFISSKKNRTIAIAQLLTFFVILTSLYAGFGYLYNFRSLHSVEVYFRMAVHTALCFSLLSVGILAIRPNKGFMRIITFNGLGGTLARRLIPIAILVPVVFDWLRFEGQRAGVFPNVESGISLISISAVITLSVVVLVTAYNLNRIDKSRKSAEKRLIQAKILAEKAKKSQEQFLANMSHEIRTPMNGVVGMISLLNLTRLNEEQKSYLDTIRISSQSLLRIIDDILDFSKIESGKLELEELPFSVVNAVEETFDLLRLEANSKNLELIYFIQPDVPEYIMGDITRFRQIMVNLISNGIKFTPSGEILVNVRVLEKNETECTLKISVKDTGIGIEKESLNKLFKAFSQADVSTTRRFGGTGLGLAISANLVSMMDGEIGVDSIPGQGSDFYFTIKAKIDNQSIENKDVLRENLLAGKSVMIVDDNLSNLSVLKQFCKTWKMQVYTFSNGADAIRSVNDTFFDFVLLDLIMPEKNGIETAQELKKTQGAGNSIYVLLSSGQGEINEDADLFDAMMIKPLHIDKLHSLLNNLVSNKGTKIPDTATYGRSAIGNKPQTPINILVAEDNIINLKIMMRMLELFGHHPDYVSNGFEAVNAFENKFYDMVFMDVQMPVMDGFEATSILVDKFKNSARKPIIIALTANALKGEKERCIAAGMNDYLSKPFQISDIQNLIGKWGGNS